GEGWGVGGLLRELRRHLGPECADGDAGESWRLADFRRVERGADKDGDFGSGNLCDAGALNDFCRVWHFVERRYASKQMIEREHTVRFAAAECSFQLDHRLTAFAGHAPQRLYEQATHPLGDVGTPEEFDRVLVLDLSRAAQHLR